MSREFVTWTWDFTVQANWTAFCNGIHQAILNRGWLQTTDTGQIDPATVTKPSTTNTFVGYTMYKTNDGVGDIFYLKIRWAYTTTTFSYLEVTLGTGTNGAGTLTGNLSSVFNLNSAPTAPGAVVASSIVSGDAGHLTIQNSYDHFSHIYTRQFVTVARSVGSAGTPNTRGMEMFSEFTDNGGAVYGQFIPGPSYNNVTEARFSLDGPQPKVAVTGWKKNGINFWTHPSGLVHPKDSNYPNPYIVIAGEAGFNDANILRLTDAYGVEREYYVVNNNTGLDHSGQYHGVVLRCVS